MGTALARPRERRRGSPRSPYQEVASLSWQDSSGRTFTARGRCVDRSELGLKVEVQEPVETRQVVQVQLGRSRPVGLARVRHCTRKGFRFAVGLEFTAGFRWSDVN